MSNHEVEPEFTDHALDQAGRRGLDDRIVRAVALSPEQVIPVRPGREIRQSRFLDEATRKPYLVRVVVDVGDRVIIVTMYRTSRISKYWIEG